MSENLIGATTAIFPIRLSVAVASPVDVEWATRDGSAIAGSDYKAASGTVTFLPGETEKQIEVQVYGQAITPADDKVFFIRLNPPSNAVLVDAILTCTINIIDDQGIPSVAVVVAEGRRGPKGDPGLSAYEQAVLMGYTGTLAEWMDQIADASKAADRAEGYAISAGEDALKAQNAAKNAVFAGVIFPTTAEGVDPILGVQNGAYFNVRSPMSEHYIDEYQNVNGVAVATGKSYPTSDHLQNISDHTALPFVTGESYALNRRVVLTNGDIVKSTIDENENDPNEDMTGWVKDNSASQIFDESGLSQQDVNDSALIKSPQLFGAKGSANNDQVAFTNLSADYAYALGAEYTVPVWRTQATKFIGNGTKVNLDSVNGDTTVCLQIKPNSNYSDIDFVNNPAQKKPWSYSTIGNNSVLTNVGFYNFDDPNEVKNSWGIYLENKENITLINPKFGGNGVSDIAIVDNVKNINIFNAVNTVDPDGVHLDIEPNDLGNIENINIIGGKYSTINVLENNFLSIGIKSLNIIGANVKLLELRGGQTKIIGGKVEKIKGNWANALDYEGMQNEYFCSLEVDGFNLSENLLEDEFMNSLSAWDTNSFFSLYAPDGASIIRKKDDNGYYLSINANKNKNYHVLNQRGFTSLPLGADVICIAMAYSVENTGSETMFQPCIVSFFNDSDVKVGDSYSLKGGRTAAGMNYDWSHEVSIFDIPSGATKFKITVRNNKTGSTLNVRKIGVHTLTKTDGAGNFNAVVASYGVPNLKNSYKQAVTPVDLSYGYNGLLVETPDAAYKYVGSGNTFTLQLVEKVKVFGSASVNASIPANTTHTETKTITGAKVGQTVSLSPNAVIGASVQLWGEVTAVDTVALYLRNTGATSASVVASLNIVLE